MLEKFPTAASNCIVETSIALRAVRSNQPFPEANVKELTFENKMPNMEDMDDMPEMAKMNEEGYTPEEEEFFVDGKMPKNIEGVPSFEDLLKEYREKYGKE